MTLRQGSAGLPFIVAATLFIGFTVDALGNESVVGQTTSTEALSCGSFGPAVQYVAGDGAFFVAVGEFDGDGNLDLVVTNRSDDDLSILLGNGDGSFQAKVDYAAGDFPYSVAIGDFNNDGRADLAVANASDGPVSVLTGNGDGSFQPRVEYAVGNDPSWVAVGDFDNDGSRDLVAANSGGTTVSVLLGNGDGTFQPKVDFGAGAAPYSVAVADLNMDGKADLAVANLNSFDVSVLAGNGDGTFQAAVNYSVGAGPASVVVGDFDNNGSPDLAVVNSGGSSNDVSVLLGNGNGTFQPAVDYAAGSIPTAAAVADFDDDGNLDLAVENQSSNDVSILRGNGDGTFQSPINHAVGGSPRSIASADLNADGRSDLVTANFNDDNVSVLFDRFDDGNPCTVDTCNPSTGAITHTPGNAGATCRASAGECDESESCTGASAACPPDGFEASGTACTPDGDECTSDVCDGASAFCTHVEDAACTACLGNAPPVVAGTTASNPMTISGGTASVSAAFGDAPGQTHTCSISWGDGSPDTSGTVTETNSAGSCTGSHSYAARTTPAVYEVTITVADDCGGTGSGVTYVVLYDPDGGFVTGGGWINSPPLAYLPDPGVGGKANFGFVSGYKKDSTIPEGSTNFHFNAAGFKFESDAYEWLVISGPMARYRGTGSVNGVAGYGFQLTAWDGQVNGGGGIDRFRIKIWQGNPGNVIYDNERTSPDGADPVTALGGGSIVIHKK